MSDDAVRIARDLAAALRRYARERRDQQQIAKENSHGSGTQNVSSMARSEGR
jgi:hypothetical protein